MSSANHVNIKVYHHSTVCFKVAKGFMQRINRGLDMFSFQVKEMKKELKKKGQK